MSGKRSQRKGADGERELCCILREAGYNVQRGGSLTYGTIPDVIGLPGVHIEVKRQEQLNLSAALHQAQDDSERFNDGIPAVFHRRNRESWRGCVIGWCCMEDVFAEAQEARDRAREYVDKMNEEFYKAIGDDCYACYQDENRHVYAGCIWQSIRKAKAHSGAAGSNGAD